MSITRFLIATLSLLVCVLAQGAQVAFTSVPAVVVAGSSYSITWAGGNGTPVTITLRKGDPRNLDTVGVLADNIAGSSYQWTVSNTLETASDYALQITQSQTDINYSGLFSLSGGVGPSSIAPSPTISATMALNTTLPASSTIPSSTETGTPSATTSLTTTMTITKTTIGGVSATGIVATTLSLSAVSSSKTLAAATSATSSYHNGAVVQGGSFAALAVGVLGAIFLG